MSEKPPVAIVGGGLAGLVASRELQARGIPVQLFEASEQLGGLARTVRDETGFSFDFGAHFITNRLARELGGEDLCELVPRYGESVVTPNGTYSYPFGFARSPAFVSSMVRSRLRPSSPPSNAAEGVSALYGSRMAQDIAIPLLEGWSGMPADSLAPAVIEKMDEGLLKTFWLKAVGRVKRRAVTIGYTREKPSSAAVWHVYPTEGVGSLIQRLATQVGEDVIKLSSPVEKIHVQNERVRAISVNGEEVEVAAAMSTAPVHILSRLVEGTTTLDYLARFRYRPMVFVNLLLEGRGYIPNVVAWYTDPDLPFFRLTETPLSMPWLAPDNKTTLMADFTADVGDETWTMDDDTLAKTTLEAIERFVPGIRDRYIGCRVLRTPLAYPLFLNEYEEDRQRFAQGTGVSGLYGIGRNGEFAHILMEDVYWRTKKKVEQLAAELPALV